MRRAGSPPAPAPPEPDRPPRGLDIAPYFDTYRSVQTQEAVDLLSALAQESRLDVFRLLVEVGPEGLPAGEIGQRLGLATPTLSFHLKELRHAGLVACERRGRCRIYRPAFDVVNRLLQFLTAHCCRGLAPRRRR